jgi:hypothetical protein
MPPLPEIRFVNKQPEIRATDQQAREFVLHSFKACTNFVSEIKIPELRVHGLTSPEIRALRFKACTKFSSRVKIPEIHA